MKEELKLVEPTMEYKEQVMEYRKTFLDNMELKIEIPQIKDWEKVNQLAKQVHKLHVHWRPDLFLDVENVISIEDFEKLVENEEIVIAKLEKEIVGYMVFNIKEKIRNTMKYRKQLSIEAICVDEKYRSKGIGTKLLNYAKKIGKEKNCTNLYLTVNEENEGAIKLYEKFGFKVKNIAYSIDI